MGLPGTESSSTQGETDGFDALTPVFNTPFPSATPTPVPTSTLVPLPTPAPVPTVTPAVGDSFTTLLRQVRTVFTAADKQAAINALVPAPISLEIPADAELERLQLEFGRWDLWADATGEFPPVDRAASVVVEYSFLTNAEIDDIRIAYRDSSWPRALPSSPTASNLGSSPTPPTSSTRDSSDQAKVVSPT